MQHVSGHWYRLFNYMAVGFSAIYCAAVVFAQVQGQTDLIESFGLFPLTAVIAVMNILYGLVIFNLLARTRDVAGISLVSVGVFLTNVLIIAFNSGGLDSPYIALMILIAFAAGAYGTYFTITILLTYTAYFVLALPSVFDSFATISVKYYVVLLTCYVSLTIGFVLWRRGYDPSNPTASPMTELSNKLKSEHTQSEILIEAISDGVVVVNSNGAIQFFNPAASNLSGWNVKDALSLDHKLVLKFVDAKGKQIEDADNPFTCVLTKCEPFSSHEVILQAKEGDITELSMSVSPVTDSNGRLTAAIAVLRDISEQKQQERQRAEFISTASHEMRTPVAAIEGYLALSLNPKVSTVDDKARGFLVKAHEATQHLGMLFRDLLTASKSEDGRLENHPEPVEMGALVQQVADDVRFTAEKKGLTLNCTFGGQEKAAMSPIFYSYVDPERMREVIVNLVDNATKFTTKGGITIDLRGDTESIQISVTDTGLGIAADDIGHLFQKFYRIDNSATRTISGTGLGLYICKQIVELYKGRIWAESELGKGTSFFIKLPRLEQARAERLIAQKKGDTTIASQPVTPGTVIDQPEVDALKAARTEPPAQAPAPPTPVVAPKPQPTAKSTPAPTVATPTPATSPQPQASQPTPAPQGTPPVDTSRPEQPSAPVSPPQPQTAQVKAEVAPATKPKS